MKSVEMYKVPKLPLPFDLESKRVLKKLAQAHRALAELKGVTQIIPNQSILINTLSLQEAKDSSAIENIITSHDELYRCDRENKIFSSRAAKEVYNYATALRTGAEKVKTNGLLTNTHLLEIQAAIEENRAGFRTLPGTELKNDQTGQVVYTPPQEAQEVASYMHNLEQYINDESLSDADPLTKMAVIHHQFESIHPFYDGNGRTGRIINVLFLVKEHLLDTPVLYLSRYINKNKGEYYRLLQAVRQKKGAWEEWVLYMLEAVIQTSQETVEMIRDIKEMMQHHKNLIRKELPKIYSQDLLNNLFCHPYTKIDFLMHELQIHRNTASKYLAVLVEKNILFKHRIYKDNFYINKALFEFLCNWNSD